MKFSEMTERDQEEIKKGVRLFDPENSGHIETSHLGNVLRWLKLIPTDAEIEEFCYKLDPKSTGKIHVPLVYSVIARLWPSQPKELENKAWGAFLMFDKLDMGRLSSQEFQRILTRVGKEPVPENEVKKLIAEFADPKDGFIEYGRIIKAWLK